MRKYFPDKKTVSDFFQQLPQLFHIYVNTEAFLLLFQRQNKNLRRAAQCNVTQFLIFTGYFPKIVSCLRQSFNNMIQRQTNFGIYFPIVFWFFYQLMPRMQANPGLNGLNIKRQASRR